MRRGPGDETGAVSAVALALVTVGTIAALAVADAGNLLLAHVRAEAAASAAALAAASAQWRFLGTETTPEEAARQIADANGVRLDSCQCPTFPECGCWPDGPVARVTVSVPTRRRILVSAPARTAATAAARLDPGRLFSPDP